MTKMNLEELEVTFTDWVPENSIIKVIGVGGGGCNAVDYMYNHRIQGCTFSVCNTDSQSLKKSHVPIKIQLGSGWWFLDQEDGMKKQMNALSSLGLLSRFVGMLTDSRSFLSYPRHEYFRRILCNLIGEDIQNGKLPQSEMAFLHQMVKDISYNNADNYFGF